MINKAPGYQTLAEKMVVQALNNISLNFVYLSRRNRLKIN